MPTLLRILTDQFELTVQSKNIDSRLARFTHTLSRKHKKGNDPSFYGVKLIPNGHIEECEVNGRTLSCTTLGADSNELIASLAPLFFENMQYQFKWEFRSPDVKVAFVTHRLRHVTDSFHFSAARITRIPKPACLSGVINTGNDIGRLALPVSFEQDGQKHTSTVSFDVLPTKMDLHTDMVGMYDTIDAHYPLWRFSLAARTEQDASKGQRRESFPLLWLANFATLRKKLFTGLKVIANAPHSRLQDSTHMIKAERLKGRVSHRLAERVLQDRAHGRLDKRYQVNKKYLSVDTPENRFIKMVAMQCKRSVDGIYRKLSQGNQSLTTPRLSDAFLDEIRSWQAPLVNMQKQAFMREVGDFNGVNAGSLVLQQKTGYSAVYKVWQELKYYLDAFDKQALVSMKSIADVYEVWCFLSIRNLLTEHLGFQETANNNKLETKQFAGFEYKLKDGLAGAFSFERHDGVQVELAHEPIFKAKSPHYRTFLITQKPDILLKVKFPDGKACILLFDAKYQIESIKLDTKTGEYIGKPSQEQEDAWLNTSTKAHEQLDFVIADGVPDGAINQMHRYRDALLHIDEGSNKSRPVFGAFALYPGYFEQVNNVNPYTHAINEIGIGAFALLPSSHGNSGSKWLLSFLTEQIGLLDVRYEPQQLREKLYVKEAARIPYHGMKQTLYRDLLLTARIGNNRMPDYIDGFSNGKARCYHMPVDTFALKYQLHVVQELAYLAIASYRPEDHFAEISYVWPVASVETKARRELTPENSGSDGSEHDDKLYYVFDLLPPLALTSKLSDVPVDKFRSSVKLTSLSDITGVNSFEKLPPLYEAALFEQA